MLPEIKVDVRHEIPVEDIMAEELATAERKPIYADTDSDKAVHETETEAKVAGNINVRDVCPICGTDIIGDYFAIDGRKICWLCGCEKTVMDLHNADVGFNVYAGNTNDDYRKELEGREPSLEEVVEKIHALGFTTEEDFYNACTHERAIGKNCDTSEILQLQDWYINLTICDEAGIAYMNAIEGETREEALERCYKEETEFQASVS